MIPHKNRWPNTGNAVRYKLLAEIVVELVHSSSWDSYKCHTLSSLAKLREAAKFCKKIIKRTIPKAGLRPIVEEVNDAISNDLVISIILKKKNLSELTLSLDYSDPIEKTLGRVELLLDIAVKEYQECCETTMKSLCSHQGSKIQLQTITKLYVSLLVNSGFSRHYILASAEKIFRSKDIGRCTPALLQKFFKHFDKEDQKKYKVLVSGRTSYIEFMADLYGLKTYSQHSALPNFPIQSLASSFGKGKRKRIVVFPEIKASDPFSAAKTVEMILGVTKSFHYLHPSQVGGGLDKVIFVVDNKRNVATRIDVSNLFQPHQHLRSRLSEPSSAEGLASFVFKIGHRSDRSRQQRLVRSLSSVALASNSTDLESRLVTIWSAFEALLPEPSNEEGKRVRITHFVPLIVPCACYDYLWINFSECYGNCAKQFGSAFKDCISLHSGVEGAKGLVSIMLGEKTAKSAVLKQVNSSPLMLSRLGKLHKLVNDPAKLIKYWALHEKRVEWQIHRIYRERNGIVHTGEKNSFLEGLVENSYGYYRGVFLGLEAVDKKFGINDPTRALELISELYKDKKRKIQRINDDKSMNAESRKEAVLNFLVENRLC